MRLDKHGSKPEVQDFGHGDFVAQNYTEREWDHQTNKPRVKTALRDEGLNQRAFRANFDKIDWSSHGGAPAKDDTP